MLSSQTSLAMQTRLSQRYQAAACVSIFIVISSLHALPAHRTTVPC